jgi:hypothetical protein
LVSDLEKLSRALSQDTPEEMAEREISQRASEIESALRRDGVYVNQKLGIRISADLPAVNLHSANSGDPHPAR